HQKRSKSFLAPNRTKSNLALTSQRQQATSKAGPSRHAAKSGKPRTAVRTPNSSRQNRQAKNRQTTQIYSHGQEAASDRTCTRNRGSQRTRSDRLRLLQMRSGEHSTRQANGYAPGNIQTPPEARERSELDSKAIPPESLCCRCWRTLLLNLSMLRQK